MKSKLFYFAFLLCSIVSFSQTTFTVNDINYKVTSTAASNTVEVNGGSVSSALLNIPDEVVFESVTYAVTSIGDLAYDLTPVSTFFAPKLSEIGFFRGNLVDLQPRRNVFEYELNSALFTDHAKKLRIIALPPGTAMKYTGDGLPDFPDGTMISKTFYYIADERDLNSTKQIIETRVLLKRNGDWITGNYLWNADMTDAILTDEGHSVAVDYTDINGVAVSIGYKVPDNQGSCVECHQKRGSSDPDDIRKVTPIGPKLRNINKIVKGNNQLQNLIDMQWIVDISDPNVVTPLPDWKDKTLPLKNRTLAYIEVNCAHCHSPGGFCDQPFYDYDFSFGPGELAPGYTHKEVINHIRSNMSIIDNGKIYMPKLGTTVIDTEALDMIRAYSTSLGN